MEQPNDIIESDVPARLDRLPWSRWHWRIVIALGITWLLDGLETMLGGALVGILKDPRTLHLSDSEIGLSATVYLAGAVTGALVFGYATDRLGRKRLFFITLGALSVAPLPRPPFPGISGAFACFEASPARESAASMRPLTRPSMN